MDCRTARHLLDYARPAVAELEAADLQALQGHLAECPECATVERVELALDAKLGRVMLAVPVPDGLRDRLLNRLNAERDAWYRRRLWKLAPAVAACVALAVGGLWLLLKGRPAELDLNARHVGITQRHQRGFDEVTADLQRLNVKGAPPRDFNYHLLASYDLTTLEGQRVARLVFRDNNELAYVYVLHASQFDLPKLKNQPVRSGGAWTVEVRASADPNVVYLVEYTGGSIDPFLARNPGPLA